MKICFATNNANKIREISAMLPKQIQISSLADIGCFEELPETQRTIPGNAFQKAKFVNDRFGIPCFADDSGLEVTSLNGEPGVDSAIYAGPQRSDDDNIALLLNKLGDHADRSAQFVTVICLVGHTPEPRYFEGRIKGTILREKRGNNGFGYDPIFLPDGYDQTFAEIDFSLKNSISHRAIATQKLIHFLTGAPTP